MATAILNGSIKEGTKTAGYYSASYDYARYGNFVRYTVTCTTTVNSGWSETYGATSITWQVGGVTAYGSIGNHSGTASTSVSVDVYGGTTSDTTKSGYCLMSGIAETSFTAPFPAGGYYSISYNANGGTGTTSTGTKLYNETYYISANGYTRTGYDFVGWNTNPNATTAQYLPGQSYTTNAALSLYAIWRLKTYAVTYNGNEATGGTTEAQTKTYGVDLTLQENGFVRDKYNFVEWNTAADGTGTSYAAGATYTTNAALTLYAIWIKANIPVWINIGGTLHQVEKAYVNVGGVIKEADVYINVGGEIKAIT